MNKANERSAPADRPLPAAAAGADEATVAALEALDERLRWLSVWTIHNANHLRESRDGLKVGGHQASCASMTAIMSALYGYALGPTIGSR
jgi:pyruvate dehydrogenase E1 component